MVTPNLMLLHRTYRLMEKLFVESSSQHFAKQQQNHHTGTTFGRNSSGHMLTHRIFTGLPLTLPYVLYQEKINDKSFCSTTTNSPYERQSFTPTWDHNFAPPVDGTLKTPDIFSDAITVSSATYLNN